MCRLFFRYHQTKRRRFRPPINCRREQISFFTKTVNSLTKKVLNSGWVTQEGVTPNCASSGPLTYLYGWNTNGILRVHGSRHSWCFSLNQIRSFFSDKSICLRVIIWTRYELHNLIKLLLKKDINFSLHCSCVKCTLWQSIYSLIHS